MKRSILIILIFVFAQQLKAQLFYNDFSDPKLPYLYKDTATGRYTLNYQAPGELVVNSNGAGGAGNTQHFGMILFDTASNVRLPKVLNVSNNAKVTFRAKSDAPVRLRIEMQDVSKNVTNENPVYADIPGDNTYQEYVLNYMPDAFIDAEHGKVDSTRISELHLLANPFEGSPFTGTITFDYIYIGNKALTGLTHSEIFASTNLFPNPATDLTSIEFNVIRPAKIKILLNDLTGREIRTISNEFMNSGLQSRTFDVSDLTKGVYGISYQVEGKPVYMQRFIVK